MLQISLTLAAFLEQQARRHLCASSVLEMDLEDISVRPATRRSTTHIMEPSGDVHPHMLYITHITAQK